MTCSCGDSNPRRSRRGAALTPPGRVGGGRGRPHCAGGSACHHPCRSPGLFHQLERGGGKRQRAARPPALAVTARGSAAPPAVSLPRSLPARLLRWSRPRRRSLGERVPRPSRRRLVSAASVEQLGRKCWRGAVRTGEPAGHGRLAGEGLRGALGRGRPGAPAGGGGVGRALKSEQALGVTVEQRPWAQVRGPDLQPAVRARAAASESTLPREAPSKRLRPLPRPVSRGSATL